MKNFSLPSALLEKIKSHAEKEYPQECCGVILGPQDKPEVYSRWLPCRNVQDEYHALDPVNFPRTSKSAYFMDPKDLLRFQKEARSQAETLKVIYHSHIDAPSSFSEEDARMAVYEDTPVYPGVSYLILSVRAGKFDSAQLYNWNKDDKKYQALNPSA
jgi:[CysO sulfur-carrier protein]-S-L-cysteine hydrolase